MLFEGLHGVRRAGGIEATWRGPALHRSLIPADGAERDASNHGRRPVIRWASWSSMAERSWYEASAASGRAPKRYQPGPKRSGWEASSARRRRRIRFRTTAGPKARPSAKATWVWSAAASTTEMHHSGPDETRRPHRRSSSKPARSRIRWIRPTAAPDRGRGVPSGSRDRRGCSSAGGSRASSHDDDCWVERSSSPIPPGIALPRAELGKNMQRRARGAGRTEQPSRLGRVADPRQLCRVGATPAGRHLGPLDHR